jgi:hydroxyacylglutathione hydrolase
MASHGAGSACGKTLGRFQVQLLVMKKWETGLQHKNDEEGFVKYLLEDQPEPPKYFAMMKN